MTVAGSQTDGDGRHQLNGPRGLFVDESDTVYIADHWNHRVVAWKVGAKTGDVVAGGRGEGDRLDQLNSPTDVIVDPETDTLLICDSKNRRVVRWPRHHSLSPYRGQIVVDNIDCWGLAMDKHGSFYVSDTKKHEVRRYEKNNPQKGMSVAGGHGRGEGLNQLNWPTYLSVDAQSTLYVSDSYNHRVMQWMKGAREGIVVAGGHGQGTDLTQLSHPRGVWANGCEHVYVVDSGNVRLMCWTKGAKQGTLIVGGDSSPVGLFFDRHGHLYLSDMVSHRVQRFSLLVS